MGISVLLTYEYIEGRNAPKIHHFIPYKGSLSYVFPERRYPLNQELSIHDFLYKKLGRNILRPLFRWGVLTSEGGLVKPAEIAKKQHVATKSTSK